MGLGLLLVLSLAASLVFVAVVMACAARIPSRFFRALTWVLPFMVVLLLYGTAIFVGGLFRWQFSLPAPWFFPMVFAAICFIIGSVVLNRKAFPRRPVAERPDTPVDWSIQKLLLAFMVLAKKIS